MVEITVSSVIGVMEIPGWNPWSYSNERQSDQRHEFCKTLKYDLLGLTELHNLQSKTQFQGRRWICSVQAGYDENGKCEDAVAGVVILLSNRIAEKVGTGTR